MNRTYSDDEYADALEQQDWDRYVASVAVSFDSYMVKLDELNKASMPRELHRNHVHHEVYAPGDYFGNGRQLR